MSVQLLTNVVIGLALVGFVAARQLRWRRVDRTTVWKMPAVLGIIGLFSLGSASKGLTIHSVDIVLIGVELVISIGTGLLMGRLTTFRTAQTPDARGRLIEARTGGVGAALWIVLIVVRIGIDVIGGYMGAQLLTATGVILLSVAINRAAAALVLDGRLPQVARVRA
ncbi:MAG: hypothetical protein JWP75_2964 [Frondihabitans sp.]|nr:hypothetical protein [Frondihabitans sp.]